MAEFMMKHLVEQAGRADEFIIESAAVSTEETGNDIYPPAKRIMRENNIPFSSRGARQITRADYARFDYIVCMDKSNLRLLKWIIGDDRKGKVSLLLEWADLQRDVADPWYTGDFRQAYSDILMGCEAMLTKL